MKNIDHSKVSYSYLIHIHLYERWRRPQDIALIEKSVYQFLMCFLSPREIV